MLDDYSVKQTLEEIHKSVRNISANILATISLMRKDHSLDLNTDYGFYLTKLENDLVPIYIRSCKKLNVSDITSLYTNFDNCIKKHRHPINYVEDYNLSLCIKD